MLVLLINTELTHIISLLKLSKERVNSINSKQEAGPIHTTEWMIYHLGGGDANCSIIQADLSKSKSVFSLVTEIKISGKKMLKVDQCRTLLSGSVVRKILSSWLERVSLLAVVTVPAVWRLSDDYAEMISPGMGQLFCCQKQGAFSGFSCKFFFFLLTVLVCFPVWYGLRELKGETW